MSLIRTVRARLPVEFSMFLLFDHFGDARQTELEMPAGRWIGRAGRGGAAFHASDQSIRAFVELELWSGPPATAGQFEGAFTTDSGRVMLCSTTASPGDVVVELPGPGEYAVRAARLGESVDEEGFQTERWRLQVWPR